MSKNLTFSILTAYLYYAASKETPTLLQITQNIVRRKHHGVPSTAIIVSNYVRYDAETSTDH